MFQTPTTPSSSREARRAALGQCRHTLADVFTAEQDALREQLELLEGVLVEAVTEIDQLLRQPDRERRVRRDHGCEAGRPREGLARRPDLAHQPPGERLLRADY